MSATPNKWPKTAFARNMKLFAQALIQQTNVATFEGFRASSLNTLSRFSEAIDVLNSITSGRPFDSYIPVRDELLWSVKSDLVLQDSAYNDVRPLFYHIGKEERSDVVRGVQRLVVIYEKVSEKYKSNLENLILRSIKTVDFSDDSPRDFEGDEVENNYRIVLLSSHYISYLSSRGYSRKYISRVANLSFFNGDISKAKLARVENFFKKFDDADYRYNVYLCANKETSDYLCAISDAEKVSVSDLKLEVRSKIADCRSHVGGDSEVICYRVKAKDPFSAAHSVYERTYGLMATSVLGSWEVDLEISKEICVATIGHGSVVNYTPLPDDISSSRRVSSGGGRLALNRSIKSSSVILEGLAKADLYSRERVLNAFTTGYTAVRSQNPEIQLISLWSAFEALLSPPPANASSRISHYEKLITPCVVSRYPRRYFIYTSNTAARSERRAYTNFINEMKSNVSEELDNTSMLMLAATVPEHRPAFDRLILACVENPLLSHMLSTCLARFGSPKDHLKNISGYAEKVSWQISRIYRARNYIVHAGKLPAFSDSLSVNAYEYLSTAIFNIVDVMTMSGVSGNIDRAVELIYMDYYSSLELIKKSQSKDNFVSAEIFKIFRSKI